MTYTTTTSLNLRTARLVPPTTNKPETAQAMQSHRGRGQGFASMSTEKKREIASKGGKTAHSLGTAHKWTPEEAQIAGRLGGSISRRRPRLSTF